jgi:hypothetical protein
MHRQREGLLGLLLQMRIRVNIVFAAHDLTIDYMYTVLFVVIPELREVGLEDSPQ